MTIIINGKNTSVGSNMTLCNLKRYMDYDISIVNGYQTEESYLLCEDDSVVLIKKGEMPDKNSLEAMISARHTPKLYDRFKSAVIGIAGLGGLGSNIAAMLARSGIGKLVIADFDTVDPTNLNRQHYFVRHLGMPKTAAISEQLHDMNPFILIEDHNNKINESNVCSIFSDCSIICEAFDNPECKAMLVNTVSEKCPEKIIIAASGMAGTESSNTILTEKRLKNLYICGDNATQADFGTGLMAPRVEICAGHQANMVLRILAGEFNP